MTDFSLLILRHIGKWSLKFIFGTVTDSLDVLAFVFTLSIEVDVLDGTIVGSEWLCYDKAN